MPPPKIRKKKKILSPRLKAHLEAKKHESVLIGDVHRYIQTIEDDRATSAYIHGSEVSKADWCPRATWHRLVGHAPKAVAPHPLRLTLIFDRGSRSGEQWQQWTGDMGILWGEWKCIVCGDVIEEWSNSLPMIGCSDRISGVHIWKYREVPFFDPATGIAGHADGIVNPTGDECLVMENKTIGPGTLRKLHVMSDDDPDEMSSDKFSRVSKLLPDHFIQMQIYLRLAQDLEPVLGPITRAVAVYEHKADQQAREFVVEYEERWTNDIWDTALDIQWSIDKGREVRCPYGGCRQCRAYED